ncbi:HNH endonuclease signature motif containing protein [Microbispora rosea]|uniref:HNH endonuclease signature motif containing protein n=1 Tax=Microbispora rosea TaxID=58117 RepID=UPI000A78839A|nr:HNH endonuclease signature motif containing protein [Microbispora rosea]
MDLFEVDPNRHRRSNNTGDGWWDRLTAGSPLWSADGSSAREHFPIIDLQPPQHTSANTSDGAPGTGSTSGPGADAVGADGPGADDLGADGCGVGAGGRPRARSSWVLVGSLRESAQALALTPLPEDADVCLAEAEDLLFARDRITCALADRVGRVHAAGRAKQHGHASTRSWLRTAAGMSVAGAGRLLTLAVELARLPRVREKFAAGQLAAGVVEAICTATAQLSNEHDDRPLSVRQADALIALLEQKIATELLVLVNAESLPTDPATDDASDPHSADSDPAATADTGDSAAAADDTSGSAPGEAATTDPAEAETEAHAGADGAADASAGSDAGADGAADAGAGNADRATTGPRDEESRHPGPDERGAGEHGTYERGTGGRASRERGPGKRRAGECEPHDTASAASAEGDDTPPVEGADRDRAVAKTGAPDAGRHGSAWPADDGGPSHAAPSNPAPSGITPSGTAPSEAAQPDPPPEDNSARRTHAGPRPAGEYPRGQDTASAGEPPGRLRGTEPGALFEMASGALLGTVPGLLLATGQMLPVTSVHRLARTSALVRLVMDAEGQVLDMGRKVRLATPAQRRSIFARYATCWIDGCPLPATMCQIDHADNWSSGGLTDLKLLGPACQFHNRDRYQHPHRYTRRKTGTDRWAFTYRRLGATRLRK